jgi:DNA-directed RNA polymerase specialized sigma24 family protein
VVLANYSGVAGGGALDVPGAGLAAPGAAPSDQALLARVRKGDREAAAELVRRHEGLIRRRVRGKMGVLPEMRRIFDSLEVLSSVSRRLDGYVRQGRVRSRTVRGMHELLCRIVDATVADKQRQFLRTAEARADARPVEEIAGSVDEPMSRPRSDEFNALVANAMKRLRSDVDRQILALRLAGAEHDLIAAYTGLTPAAVRKRFQAMRELFHELFGEGAL